MFGIGWKIANCTGQLCIGYIDYLQHMTLANHVLYGDLMGGFMGHSAYINNMGNYIKL